MEEGEPAHIVQFGRDIATSKGDIFLLFAHSGVGFDVKQYAEALQKRHEPMIVGAYCCAAGIYRDALRPEQRLTAHMEGRDSIPPSAIMKHIAKNLAVIAKQFGAVYTRNRPRKTQVVLYFGSLGDTSVKLIAKELAKHREKSYQDFGYSKWEEWIGLAQRRDRLRELPLEKDIQGILVPAMREGMGLNQQR